MSYLFFMDESGHDHKSMPYEVRGGIVLHAKKIWSFITAMKSLEESCFGDLLYKYKSELKGHKLLDKERFKWAQQKELLDDAARRKCALAFLNAGIEKRTPRNFEFAAYGQACLKMARGVFSLLRDHDAKLFASVIPLGVKKPEEFQYEEYLRKDHVFLFERFFYFLESKKDHGLLVLDESDKSEDRKFVRKMEAYFTSTQTGRYRTAWIVPAPLFVASDMSYPVQAADICIYCLNWGFRLPMLKFNAAVRPEIADEFGPWLRELQYHGDAYVDGQIFPRHGICFVPDPYTRRGVK